MTEEITQDAEEPGSNERTPLVKTQKLQRKTANGSATGNAK